MIKYKVAIIGLGRIGYLLGKDKKREQPASHSHAFLKNKRTEIIAGSDLDSDRLALWKKDFSKAGIYNDYKKLLANEFPDIIVVAVNEEKHFEVMKDVLDCKPKLVVLEKPVAPDISTAEKILKYAKLKKVPVLINHERRFSSDYIMLKKILYSKSLGEIRSVHASLSSNVFVWNKKSKASGCGMLIHDSTHLVDIIYFLFKKKLNQPVVDRIVYNKKKEIISLMFHSLMGNNITDKNSNFSEKRKKDISSDIFVSFEINGDRKYFGFEVDIKGTAGSVLIGNGYFKVYRRKESPYYENFYSLVRDEKFQKPSKTGYFYNMSNNCVLFLDKKEKLYSTIDDGVNALRFLYDLIKKF